MRLRKNVWLGATLIAAGLVAGGVVAQQLSDLDFPTFKGGNARTGTAINPLASGPGAPTLRWRAGGPPESVTAANPLANLVVDNTDTAVNGGTPAEPFLPNNNGFVTFDPARWLTPTPSDGRLNEAEGPYDVPIRRQPYTDGDGNSFLANPNFRTPSYRYANVVPAFSFSNPTQAEAGYTASAFEWTITNFDTTASGNYGVYVWLPAGPMRIGGQRVFPQRYFVYEIQYGANQRKVDIVDTYATGSGWVRLGNGGGRTNAVFPYDGTNPIKVRLYNTVPKDSENFLRLPAGTQWQNLLVYADAMQVAVTPGGYAASPVSRQMTVTPADGGAPFNTTVVTAVNNELTVGRNPNTNEIGTLQKGVVTTRYWNPVDQRAETLWRFSPLEESTPTPNPFPDREGPVTLVDEQVSGTFLPAPEAPYYSGTGASVASITNAPGTAAATYAPNVRPGSYDIYAWIPGDRSTLVNGSPLQLGRGVLYEVTIGGDTYEFSVNQSQARGWVKINLDRLYVPEGSSISLRVVNVSSDPSDSVAPARRVYADAVRFVGEANYGITSTPVHARALIRKQNGLIEETDVVVVADENGVIHCLDANGKDGTATEYWRYPSTRDVDGLDPNLVTGQDWEGNESVPGAEREPTAAMPDGFGMSSGLVQRVTVNGEDRDYLYIGARNGRVYCIDMTGRGDYMQNKPDGSLRRTIGTTSRVWTFPATYPAPEGDQFATSDLGSINGSVAYAAPNGQPTIYVPTLQGRIYALDALAGSTTNKTATVRWAFPALNEPNLGPIEMTPAVAFGRVYFGTTYKYDRQTEAPGGFYAIDAATGGFVWQMDRNTPVPRLDETPDFEVIPTGDFVSSPVAVAGTNIGPGQPNTVFLANENGVLYSLNAETGGALWATDELGTSVTASLGFTQITAINDLGTLLDDPAHRFPVVIVPTANGRLVAMFANPNTVNRFGGRQAWGGSGLGDSFVASTAISNNWMYAADNRGFLYAFNDQIAGGPGIFDGSWSEDIVANDQRGDMFRMAKVRLINADTFRRMKLPNTDPDALSYQQVLALAASNQLAFEWGQTAYVLVYDFPYLNTSIAPGREGTPVDPPVVNITFSSNGANVRGQAAQSRQFKDVGPNDPPSLSTIPGASPALDPALRADGYAILSFPFMNAGANAVPPGPGDIRVSITSAALSASGSQQNVILNPRRSRTIAAGGFSRYPFRVANPLAIWVPNRNGQIPAPGVGVPYNAFTLGTSTDPTDLESLMNGSENLPSTPKREDLLATMTNLQTHGSTGKSLMYVIDRSMMGLMRPDGVSGLDNVRFDRRDLAWQGGQSTVYKRLDPGLYGGYEELPGNFPNTSLDYPDIRRENVRVTKDPRGNPENPLYNGVTLRSARGPGGVALTEEMAVTDRIFVPTPVEVEIEIPRFQPPNTLANLLNPPNGPLSPNDGIVLNSNNETFQQGYMGRLQVFVDTTGNGLLDTGRREAYRTLNLSTAVDVDERLRITTPSLNLGTLPGGTGYSLATPRPGVGFDPTSPTDNNSLVYNPWYGNYANLFKEFTVLNEGNVNLLNVRVAKASTINGPQPLTIGGQGQDDRAYLDATFDLWSSIDPQYSPNLANPARPVFVQKPRPGEGVPNALQANPVRRTNPNIGVSREIVVGSLIFPNVLNQSVDAGQLRFPAANPRLGVSVPIGFPVGTYSQRVTVFEDWSNANGTLDMVRGAPEPYAEPGVELTFTVGETRLTNSYQTQAAPMIDNLLAPGQVSGHSNQHPTVMRDQLGGMMMAWTSNRSSWVQPVLGANLSNAHSIFIATLDNGATFSSSSGFTTPSGSSPLRDLNFWNPAGNGTWFSRQVEGYPGTSNAQLNALFGVGAGEAIVPNTARFANPSFPTMGIQNPVLGGAFNSAFMAFVGEVQKQTPTGIRTDSRLFLTKVARSSGGGVSILPTPWALTSDGGIAKSNPSVVQVAENEAVVFYTSTSGGRSRLYGVRFANGTFGEPVALSLGEGFASVSAPSAFVRTAALTNPSGGRTFAPVIEFVFSGRLNGRPSPEIYLGRLDLQGRPLTLGEQSYETLEADGDSGIYRSRGIVWDTTAPIEIIRVFNGRSTSLLLDGMTEAGYDRTQDTRRVDRETGLVSYETRLGGRVTLDSSNGTIRFASGSIGRGSRLFISYTPRYLRTSKQNAAGYNQPTVLFDNRVVSNWSYWRTPAGALVTNPSNTITSDRYVMTYNRAGGGGSNARPVMQTMRIGLRLPFRLPTTEDGQLGVYAGGAFYPAVSNVQVIGTGSTSGYEIDPANRNVYFMAQDEGLEVRVTHLAVDEAGRVILTPSGRPMTMQTQGRIGMVPERDESELPIQSAVNESGVVPFLDPFSYAVPGSRRPPLVWLLWTSTRNGASDLYFQSIAPQWSPVPVNRQ